MKIKHIQLQVVTTPSSTGGLIFTLNLTFPQWHCPSYVSLFAFPILGLVGVSAILTFLLLFLLGTGSIAGVEVEVSRLKGSVCEGAVGEIGVVTAATTISAAVQGRKCTVSSKPQILQWEREGREGIGVFLYWACVS
jgi:hypothetical protein